MKRSAATPPQQASSPRRARRQKTPATKTTTTTLTTTTHTTTIALLDDNNNNNNNEVVDLTGSSSPTVASAAVAAAAAAPVHARRRVKKRQAPTAASFVDHEVIDLLQDDDNDDDDRKVAAKPTISTAVQRVLDVLPQSNVDQVQELLDQHDQQVETVIMQLLSEPTAENTPEDQVEIIQAGSSAATAAATTAAGTSASGTAAAAAAAGTSLLQPIEHLTASTVTTLRREKTNQWTLDFMSPSSFVPSNDYVAQAQAYLFHEFPFLAKEGCKRLLNNNTRHYAIAHDRITQVMLLGDPQEGLDEKQLQYQRYCGAMQGRPLNTKQQEALTKLAPTGKNYIKSPRKVSRKGSDKPPPQPPMVTDPILLEELQYVQHKALIWKEEMHKHAQRKQNQKQAQRDGSAVECPCCCDSYHMEDMCQCHSGHLYCSECLENYAHAQIFGSGNLGPADKETKNPATQLVCFQESNCRAGFPREILAKALPRRTLEKHDELQSQIAIQGAQLANLAKCPKCDFQAELTNPDQIYFQCPIEDCRFESCQLCSLKWHGRTITCDQARQQEHAADGRHKVEEAMSLAKIRSCPKCQKAFLKETGCNKIICTSCNSASCYVCRKFIPKSEGYKHFCQQPHCKHEGSSCNGKCPLYTKDDEKEDAKKMRIAGLEAVAEAEGVETKVVDQLLQKTSSKRRRK